MAEIKKISQTKTGAKFVIIPRKSELSKGEYVRIERVEDIKKENKNEELNATTTTIATS